MHATPEFGLGVLKTPPICLRIFSQALTLLAVRGAEPPDSKGPSPFRYAAFGIQLAGSILLFMLLGYWVDRKLGTGGVFAIVGALLGFGAALYAMLRQLARDQKSDKDKQ